MKFKADQAGFTLLELLLVVIILAIITAAGVQMIAGQSVEQNIKSEGHRLVKELNFMCEKSVFENRPFAIEFSEVGRQVLTHRQQKWWSLEGDQWPASALDSEVEWALFLQGQPQSLSTTFDDKPHIICYPNGLLSAFELLIQPIGKQENTAIYRLASINPSQLQAGWLDEK